MDYEKFSGVLDSIPQVNCVEPDYTNKVIKEIKEYCEQHVRDKYIISLSGGVDSMVIASIFRLLKKTIICIHINYNNREETGMEEEFLRVWCKMMNIELVVHNISDIHRGDIKRSHYENITKDIRFELYKNVVNKYRCIEVILGHHKDDIIENVFNNICRGRSILDLTVLKMDSTIKNVILSRPLLNIHKDIVLEYASKYNIPYFKDTTPDWSLRGMFRRQILPLLSNAYSDNISKNLINISEQSDDWNMLIQEKIINPFINTINFNYKTVEMNIKDNILSPSCFWRVIFMKIFYQFGYSNPSRKSIDSFIKTITSDKINKLDKLDIINIGLSANCITSIDNKYKLTLVFNQ